MGDENKSKEVGHYLPNEVSAHFFGRVLKAEGSSGSKIEDPFQNLYGTAAPDKLVAPPYNPLTLAQMVEISGPLNALITAMETNVEGFGWDLVKAPHVRDDPNFSEDNAEAKKEKYTLEALFNYCNPDEDFTKLRKRLRRDLEGTGFAGIEIVRNRGGEIAEFYIIPSYTLRMSYPDEEFTEFTQMVRDENGRYIERKSKKKFRRFAQQLSGDKKVWFKEFGDPRDINCNTGKVGDSISEDNRANELLFFKLPCAYSPYGLPRWMGHIMGIFGSRKAEEINFLFFDNKTIPPLVITVSGGALTSESMTKLQDIFEKELKGVDNFHKALVIEASPANVGLIEGEKVSPVKIDVKPLTQFIQDDGLFMDYRKENTKDLSASFRLPPIYSGRSDDYTRATAMEAARVAEEQVFEPERREFDYVINRHIFSNLRINYWNFKTLGGKTTDDGEVVDAMSKVKEAIPIGVIVEAVAELTNTPVGEIPEEYYKIPLGLLSQIGAGEEAEDGDLQDKVVKAMVRIKDKLEKRVGLDVISIKEETNE